MTIRPRWPHVIAEVDNLGAVTITVADVLHERLPPSRIVQRQTMTSIQDLAHSYNRPLSVDAIDAQGTTWHMTVHPDGTVDDHGYTRRTAE